MENVKIYEKTRAYRAYLDKVNPRENTIVIVKKDSSMFAEPKNAKVNKRKSVSVAKSRKERRKDVLPDFKTIRETQLKQLERVVKKTSLSNPKHKLSSKSITRTTKITIKASKTIVRPSKKAETRREESKTELASQKKLLILPTIKEIKPKTTPLPPKQKSVLPPKIENPVKNTVKPVEYSFAVDEYYSAGQIVKKCLLFRKGWVESKSAKKDTVNFYWAFKNVSTNDNIPSNCLINRLENVSAVSNKIKLFVNLLVHCEVIP